MVAATQIDCTGKSTREINQAIRAAIASGGSVAVANPAARHNLGVALLQPGRVVFEGSVGYYCGGMADGPSIEVRGSAGWGLGEGMLSGEIVIHGNAGNGAAASIRGGTIVVRGDCGARAGVAMKGGLLVVEGSVGYMTGFMMQRGAIIVCGDAADALADSMYEGVVFLGGDFAALGNDTVIEEPSAADLEIIAAALAKGGIEKRPRFRKIVSGRKLWNFEHKEMEVWREAL